MKFPLIRVTWRIADALCECCSHVPTWALVLVQSQVTRLFHMTGFWEYRRPFERGKLTFPMEINFFLLCMRCFWKFLLAGFFGFHLHFVCTCLYTHAWLETQLVLELLVQSKLSASWSFLSKCSICFRVVYIVWKVASVLFAHTFWSLYYRSSMSEPLVSPPGFEVWPRKFYFRLTVNWVVSSGEWIFLWWVLLTYFFIQFISPNSPARLFS